MTQVRAVSFDLWNTLVVETGEGLIRPRARRWGKILGDRGHQVDLHLLEAAHEAALEQYTGAWKKNRQFRSAEAVTAVLKHLDLETDEATTDLLLESFHEAGLASEIELVPGARDVLQDLRHRNLRIAIICDIGLTPSSALSERLSVMGVLEHVDAVAWSDVFGVYKPSPAIFEWTLDQLGEAAASAVHIGDRKRSDVEGARASGMTSIRFRGVYDDPDDLGEADHVIDHLTEVVDVLRI